MTETPAQMALWTNQVVQDCLLEAGDDVDVGLAAAEYILSTQPFPDDINAALAVRHAPAGYTRERPLVIGGRQFTGGEFIPDEAWAKATPEERAKIEQSMPEKRPQKAVQGQQPVKAIRFKAGEDRSVLPVVLRPVKDISAEVTEGIKTIGKNGRASLPELYSALASRKGGAKAYHVRQFATDISTLVRSDENLDANLPFRMESAVIENTKNPSKSVFIPNNNSSPSGEGMYFQAINYTTRPIGTLGQPPEEKTQVGRKLEPTNDVWKFSDSLPSHDSWRNLKPEKGYVYHATNTDNAGDIQSSSMVPHRPSFGTDQRAWPDGSTSKRIYLTNNPSTAWQFSPEEGKPALLRIRSHKSFKKESGTGDLYLEGKKIPPRMIEILTNDGWKPLAVSSPKALSVDAFFAHDIANRQAQGILNRSLQAAKGLSAAARKDLSTALKSDPADSGTAILNFINKYRLQLAKLLSATQLASLLEGAREVAANVPTLAIFPGAVLPPPTLEPKEAVALVERLEKLTGEKRAEAIYDLPTDQQSYVQQAIAAKEASAPIIPPTFTPPSPPPGAPEGIHFPTIEEAVKQLAEKNVMTRERFDVLDAATKAKSFAVAGIDAEDTLTKIRDTLAENVREGADYETFKSKVMEAVDQGTFLSEAHMETVFRTNVQSAFSDGQMTVLQHPLIRGGFPYSFYTATHDDRVRENHLALEKLGIGGTNIYRNDDPVFQMFRPPWDYNDRCGWTPITVRHAAEKGIEEAQEWLDTGVEPATKAFVPMPPFAPPPGFQRAVASAPLSIRLSMQPMSAFGFDQNNLDAALAVRHAPAGYTSAKPLMIGGKQFTGGEFIPDEAWAKATPEEKAQVEGGSGKLQQTNQVEGVKKAPRRQIEVLVVDGPPDTANTVKRVVSGLSDKAQELLQRHVTIEVHSELGRDCAFGSYNVENRKIKVANETVYAGKVYRNNDIEEVTRHEIGHALDFLVGLSTKDFYDAYRKDRIIMKFNEALKSKVGSFVIDRGTDKTTNSREVFAQCFATLTGPTRLTKDTDFRKAFPNAMQVAKNKLESMGLL